MSDTAIWTNPIVGRGADDRPSVTWRYAIVLTLTLGVGLGAGLLFYFTETGTVYLLAVPAAGAVFLGALLAAVISLRRNWEAHCREMEQASRGAVAALERQLAESRGNRAQLQILKAEADQRAAAQEAANALLQAELDKLKKAEKNLAHERQTLESSKAVLEVHVQARTKELHKLQRRYELILNSAGEGICGLDAEGKTTFANPAAAKLTGWPLEELIGKTEREIFSRNGSEGELTLPGSNTEEQLFCRRDGTCFTAEAVRTPINENGQVVGAVLVFKDITERKRVEETLAQKAAELARSNTELEQFAFVASHDLQEPLRKIQAFGDRLKTKCDEALAPEARDYLQRMQSAATRMRTLIDDLLAFSRVMRSAQPFARVDLTAVTKEVLGDLEVRIEKSGARVEVGDLPVIEADPLQMRQLLLNLISNGLKFQPPGGSPALKIQGRILQSAAAGQTAFLTRGAATSDQAAALGPLCEISVQDNGIGFDEKYTDKIFAVFQRLHGRIEYEGTGVGLAVCRRITDRHRGTIIAHSKPGQGATFIVTLPVSQSSAASPP